METSGPLDEELIRKLAFEVVPVSGPAVLATICGPEPRRTAGQEASATYLRISSRVVPFQNKDHFSGSMHSRQTLDISLFRTCAFPQGLKDEGKGVFPIRNPDTKRLL